MLFSVPDTYRGVFWWLMGASIELLVAINTWNIDFISEELHIKTSSRWHIDPTAASFNCTSPVEIGKLTGFVFFCSIILQILAIGSITIVEMKKTRQQSKSDSFSPSPSLRIINVPEGLSEVLYICHGIGGFVVSGVVGYKGLELLFYHPRKFSLCPHMKVVGIFKYSVLANVLLFCWYLSIVGSATQFILIETFGYRKDEFKSF